MNDEICYKSNPLHGVGLKSLLIELVNHYGFDILDAYLNINCFKTNPSIESSVKFLTKADWAREKVEAFYMYEFKSLPKASDEQFQFPPRDRIVPKHQTPGEPAILSLEDAEKLHEKRAKKAAAYRTSSSSGKNYGGKQKPHYSKNRDKEFVRKPNPKPSTSSNSSDATSSDPWAKWRKQK
jgi:uncharacterized protein (DUF2132 family)